MLQEQEVTFRIDGYTPLLMHSDRAMEQSGVRSVTKKYVPHEEAEKGLYQLPDGQLYIPLGAILQCAIAGGRKFKVKQRTLGQILSAGILKAEGIAPLIDPESGKPITSKGFDKWPVINASIPAEEGLPDLFVDERRAVVQRSGVRRWRPRIQMWATYVTFSIDPEVIGDPAILERCLQEGGRFVGLLDYRPAKGGPFGRFTAELVPNGAGATKRLRRKAKRS